MAAHDGGGTDADNDPTMSDAARLAGFAGLLFSRASREDVSAYDAAVSQVLAELVDWSNLLTADRSVLCIDPKGENARITARARAKFGRVYVLDPFGVSGQPPAAFNPLAGLDPDGLDLAEDAALLADALVHDPPGQVGEAHWNEEAKALITGLILYVVCNEGPEVRTLATVRELLTASPQEFRVMLEIMQKTTSAGGLVRRAANRHLGKSEREAAGVLSSAQRHTHFLDSVRINWTMASSDFRFADLKETKATVFLVLPPERLDAWTPILAGCG